MDPHFPTLASAPAETFADRIKQLIKHVGSVTKIARMCGFSEGVVRSWRDGHTDPSRARCVTLARALGISLVWLVAGEGSPSIARAAIATEAQASEETIDIPRRSERSHTPAIKGLATNTVDAQRLDTAIRILHSELSLVENRLSLADNADLLGKLYEMVGPGGAHVNALAMVEFNQQLRQRIIDSLETAA